MKYRQREVYCLEAIFMIIALAASPVAAQSNIPTARRHTVPFVNQPLIPDTAAPGGPGFTLTVNGTGFTRDSVVLWNGNSRPTTFVSESRLTAAIPAWDIASSRAVAVSVVNLAGGETSSPIYFPITNPTPSVSFDGSALTAGPAAGSSPWPTQVAVGDFNGDGKLDMAVVNSNSDWIFSYTYSGPGWVTIFLGNGDGMFAPGGTFLAGTCRVYAVVGDFNNDGKLDLSVANMGDDTISVLLGNGDGTFRPPVDYSTGGAPTFIALGDLNDDGKIDMAVADVNSNTVSLLLGNGDGTFQPSIDFPAGTGANGIATGDFNGEGRLDLAVADFSADNTAYVLLQVSPLGISPPSLTFGSQELGTTSAPQTVMLTNTGYQAVLISSVAASTNFGQTNNCPIAPAALGSESSCVISVSFVPSGPAGLGPQAGSITIVSSAFNSPQTISLSGIGVIRLWPGH